MRLAPHDPEGVVDRLFQRIALRTQARQELQQPPVVLQVQVFQGAAVLRRNQPQQLAIEPVISHRRRCLWRGRKRHGVQPWAAAWALRDMCRKAQKKLYQNSQKALKTTRLPASSSKWCLAVASVPT